MIPREHASKTERGFWAYAQPDIDRAVSLAVRTTMTHAASVTGMAVSTVRYFLIRAGHTPQKRGKRSRKQLHIAA